jgi:hypothetical protein
MLPFSSSRAFTANIITNDFLVITQLNKLTRNVNLADLIAILGSLDFVLGAVDLGRLAPRMNYVTSLINLLLMISYEIKIKFYVPLVLISFTSPERKVLAKGWKTSASRPILGATYALKVTDLNDRV